LGRDLQCFGSRGSFFTELVALVLTACFAPFVGLERFTRSGLVAAFGFDFAFGFVLDGLEVC